MASRGAFSGVSFRTGNRVFPFEQFDLRLNRPDIVLQRIGYTDAALIEAYHAAYLKRLKKMSFTEEMLGSDLHLPEIAIVSNNIPLSTKDKKFSFKVKATDALFPLDRLNVFVNDVPVFGSPGISLQSASAQSVEKNISLELSDGENKIQISVLNSKGVESLKETIAIDYIGKTEKPDLYVVAIGVSDYLNDEFDLKYAAKDATDLTNLFVSQPERFNEIHQIQILDKNATRENILAVRDKLMQSNIDDEVILFIAGHGLLDAQLNYYFATTDIDFANPAERGLPYDALEGLLDGIPARKKLLLMDTCHSGEVDRDETVLAAADATEQNVTSRSFRGAVAINIGKKVGLKNSFQLMQELFANLSRGSGAMVISAAGGAEYAYEGQGAANGVFTYSVIDGLKNNAVDADADGKIRVSELRKYVTEQVRKLTGGKQTPTSRRENQAFDFRVF
ncbi:MAG: caspase family protein [Calditrichaeota bacterium]|nr:caspase family protein [Calditrichota bacterium]